MAVSGIGQARAIAVFNPTAPSPGFLQTLFAGPAGDNKSYVQLLADPSLIDSFLPVAWPERDCMMLSEEPVAQVGGESLWAFAFAGEAPLVLPWTQFKAAMRERLDAKALSDNPLLQFDIVDTLDLAELRRPVFTRAFERYRSIGREAADHWRDRSILEPALARALRGGDTQSIFPETSASIGERHMRARIVDGQVTVALEHLGGGIEQVLNDAYQALRSELPEVFTDPGEVTVRRRARPVRMRKAAIITIVLVGRIRRGDVTRARWEHIDIEVVDADHFHPQLRTGRDARLTVVLGAQSDWQEMLEVGQRMGDRSTVMVSLSTSVAPLMRDLEFQEGANHPTISFFAPFATSTAFGRDPVQPVSALIHILREEIIAGSDRVPVVAQHSMLIREPMWSGQGQIEVSCRLGAGHCGRVRCSAVARGSIVRAG